MPLPEWIPTPSEEQKVTMQSWGFVFPTTFDRTLYGSACVPAIPPKRWKYVDVSQRSDLPYCQIIDTEGQVRASVHGAWKGTHDNKLTLRLVAPIPFAAHTFSAEELEQRTTRECPFWKQGRATA